MVTSVQSTLEERHASLTVDVPCTHCGLPVPRGLVRSGIDEQFCCAGCEAAYRVIHQCGLEGYYKLAAQVQGGVLRGTEEVSGFEEFDDPGFAQRNIRTVRGGMSQMELLLEGMHCAACVWLLERLYRVVPGVVDATVAIGRSTLSVTFDSAEVRPSEIARAVSVLGYTPHAPRATTALQLAFDQDRRDLIHIAVAGACSANVMLLAFALYGGAFSGGMSTPLEQTFRIMSLGLGGVCLAWPGGRFFRSAWASVRTGSASIDLPIVLALTAGGVMGLVNVARGSGELYFDSLSMLVFLLLAGRFLGSRQQRRAADSVELLFSLTSSRAVRVEPDGRAVTVPVDSLEPGQIVEVRPGQSVPVDGTVISGQSAVDEAMISGESRPVQVTVGSTVFAGTVNLTTSVRVRAVTTGRQTRAGRLMELVQRSAARKPSIVRFADSIARPFTAVACVIAMATLAVWWFIEPADAVDNAVSLLIVTCPCALGIAAPLAVYSAIGQGARSGVLIKDGDSLERLATPGTILLDKTGTLTLGRVRVATFAGCPVALELAGAVEAGGTHPIASAIADQFCSARAVQRSEHSARGGVCGVVDGHDVIVGSQRFIAERVGSSTPAPLSVELRVAVERGLTPAIVAVDGQIKAVIGLGDTLRSDALESVGRLAAAGWRVGILSGDEQGIVDEIGSRLGLDPVLCRGAATPEEKVTIVQSMATRGTLVMVGDGVNDAAAIAAATVGIAVHGGAEASLAAADIYLTRPGLASVAGVVQAGPAMVRTVRRIFAVSLAYNVVAGALAAAGLIHPVIAAVLMPLSSLSVTTVAFRSTVFPRLRSEGAL